LRLHLTGHADLDRADEPSVVGASLLVLDCDRLFATPAMLWATKARRARRATIQHGTTRRLPNVPAFSCERQREAEGRPTVLVSCNALLGGCEDNVQGKFRDSST
jgi:hypothetical protein